MKVAYFTPINPQKSGIADYSEREVLPYLSKYMDIDIFIDDNIKPNSEFLINNFAIHPYTEYEKKKDQYEIAIYNMGNNGLHEFIFNCLRKYPGITVIHDIYLHGFLWNCTLSRGNTDAYIQEFAYCYGEKGAQIAKRAIETGANPTFEYPLMKRILDNSLGVVCHSEFGVKKVLAEMSESLVTKLNQPITISEEIKSAANFDIASLKRELFLSARNPIIATFGFIFDHKRYPIILSAFKKFLYYYPNAILLLVGEDLMGIDRLISSLKLEDHVKKTGYVPFGEVLKYLAISDFCINLRYPTAGETSRSVLQLMSLGKPVIVTNIGWFAEIPENCCLKVDVDSYEEDILLEYMKLLAKDRKLANQIGRNAQKYVSIEHNPDTIAKEYYKFIKSILNGNEVIINKIAQELKNFGINESDHEIIKEISERSCDLLN